MRKLFYVFLGLVAIGLLEACNQTNLATSYTNDSTALKLGVLPTVDCLPFYYADATGLFDSLDLNIQLITFDAAMDADTAFKNGEIDGVVTDLVKLCLWQGQGDSIQAIMGGELTLWLVTAQNARLQKTESLKEKIVGITRHSALDFFTDKILESVKLQSIDLNKPQINNIRLRTLMVDQNQMDGAILPEPHASEAVARGAKRLMSTKDLGLTSLLCVVFPDSIYKTHHQEISMIQQGYDEAVVALNTDSTSRVLHFLPQGKGFNLPDTLYTYTSLPPSSAPTDSMRQMVTTWLRGRGLIK